MARLVVLDTERIKLLDEQVSLERKNKDVSKVNNNNHNYKQQQQQ